MLKVIKLNEYLYEARDEHRALLFWLNPDNTWTVNLHLSDRSIDISCDTYDEAEGTAFAFLEKVIAK
jgi:hypothetical protein